VECYRCSEQPVLLRTVWTVVETAWSRATPRIGAVLLGLAGGAGTVFLLLSGLDYFDDAGEFALPVSRAVTDAITLVG